MCIIIGIIVFLLGLMNLYPVIKFRKYKGKDWYQANLSISLYAMITCWIIGIVVEILLCV